MRATSVQRWLLLSCLLASCAEAGEITLYNGALGTAPSQQGWFYRYLPPSPPVADQVSGGVTTIDTTSSALIHAGYFTTDPLNTSQVHPGMPMLDRGQGYTVSFDVRIDAEDHGTRDDRAGFSVIVLGSDGKGIELGFWSDQVWAQSDQPLFTRAESALFQTSSMTHYALSILGAGYGLYAGGELILAGALRDYSSFGPPYSTPNQVFLGDDTSSASARFGLARVAVNLAAIPEPSSFLLLAVGAVAAAGASAGLTRARLARTPHGRGVSGS